MIHQQILCVGLPIQRHQRLSLMEKLRSVAVRVELPEVAEEVVKALSRRCAFSAGSAQTPFPDTGGVVADFLQHLGNGHLTIGEWMIVGVSVGIGSVLIPSDKGVSGMASGEE